MIPRLCSLPFRLQDSNDEHCHPELSTKACHPERAQRVEGPALLKGRRTSAPINRAANFGTTTLALFAISALCPLFLHAQFQEPTAEELKMTADPKAPGAAAVFLNLEESTDDLVHYRSFYARIKIFQEKGKELATVEIPYEHRSFNIHDVRGRTIHPDGTVYPLAVKPEDLLISKAGDRQFNKKVFNLPSVEVGSIIEYRYQVDYDDGLYSSPFWRIQQEYFVHKAHYSFTPFKAFLKGTQNETSHYLVDANGDPVNTLIWWGILPPGAKMQTDVIGRFSLDLQDIPPIPQEEWMPPIKSVLEQVLFYYKSARSGGDFWASEGKRWSKNLGHFAEPTKSIHEAVAGLIAPGDSDLDKAKKLYQAVQALDNTDFSREKGKSELKQLGLHSAKRAQDTWSQKSGSGEDITRLYLAMLRAAGLTAYEMRVVDRDRDVFNPGYLEFGQLDDELVILSINGKEILLDPGEKMCPFQTVHWKHSDAGGVRESANGLVAAVSPAQSYKENAIARTADITLDEHGAASGSMDIIMTGQEALHWRQMAIRNDLEEVKKSFDRRLASTVPDGIEAHVDHFLGMDQPNINLVAVSSVTGTLGSATSRRLFLPAFPFETRSRHPFVDEAKRQQTVDMQYGDQVSGQVVYHLPPGLTPETASQDVKIPWEGHAVFVAKFKSEPGKIVVTRTLARAFTIAKPEEYSTLRDFYQKVAAADQQQLILSTAQPAKGN